MYQEDIKKNKSTKIGTSAIFMIELHSIAASKGKCEAKKWGAKLDYWKQHQVCYYGDHICIDIYAKIQMRCLDG